MRLAVVLVALVFGAAGTAGSQLPPNDNWRTIHTQHFRVHFTPPLEDEARRAAVNAERAYSQLSAELVPPRGTIDLVVSDNVDYVNGYATPFPSNRIVVYAHPPTDASGLRKYDDWNALVVTHELTHIFHLDRSRGIWRFGQAIFGRNPLLFPNAYEPRWVLEGLAVYFESRLTGYGRLESSEHLMTARAAALGGRVPSLQELSAGTSAFPGGEVIYVYGSLMFDYLSRTRGPARIRQFVERGSRSIIPFILTPSSRSAFGVSFQTAWREWRDSLARETGTSREAMPGWRQVTDAGWFALFPRWIGDTALTYAGNKAREMPAAYEVSLSGRERNLGRRNSLSPNVTMPDGSLLFSQPDYLDPYHIRDDLFIQRNGKQLRLTTGGRLSSPDVRADGEIIAMQAMPATTRLVRVSADGRRITPITGASLDAQWADPRWSPDGTRIVAVRQARGLSEIVVLDADGKVVDSFGATRAINSSPSWSPDGRRIYFSSERTGLPQIYFADVSVHAPRVMRITDAQTGLFSPEVAPDRSQLAALLFSADGYHVGVAPLASVESVVADSTSVGPRAECPNCLDLLRGLPPLGTADTSRATPYSPWLSLLPRYWSPVFEGSTDDGTSFGAATSGADIVRRHAYSFEVLRNNRFDENSAWLSYQYAGLGLPVLGFNASQDFSNGRVFSDVGGVSTEVGDLKERDRRASLQASFFRPRFRTYSVASIGGEIETTDFTTTPDTLLPHLPAFYGERRTYPALIGSIGWSNAQRPGISISPEDGVTLSASGRARWHNGTSGGATQSLVGAGTGFKSLDLPGFAHHVIAVRGAAGITDEESTDRFSAGGTSGASLEIFPGYFLGGQRRTFGVRGYPAAAEGGIRAYSGAVEYRAPLFAPSRGFRFIPVFIDRASVSIFGETGRAWCPRAVGVCRPQDVDNPVMTSTGAELNFDTALLLDAQARFRIGVAFPLVNREILGANTAQVYATFGSSF
ncbi:MAG: hypothetical protein ACJ8AF_05685 [Gemmatimonadaceae bacterium]